MSCPSCGYTLQKLSVTTDAGGRFDIDHCGRCGGTWFDPYEINRIPYHEINRVAHLTVLPKTASQFMNNLPCPRCRKLLIKYSGESVPRGVNLFRCPKCHGIWATQKALESFKQYQEIVINKYKVKKTAFPALSVVFVPALFVALLFVSTFITITNLSKSYDERIQAGEQITQLLTLSISPTKEAITFKTKSPLITLLSYGPSSFDFMEKVISATPKIDHNIILSDLRPNTTYIYKITLIDEMGRKLTTTANTFRTKNL